MDPKLWEIERDMRSQWMETEDMNSYCNQQIIHNTMFWSQNLDWEVAHRPDLFYQAQWLPDRASVEVQDQWNNCKYEDAQVIHWHSSRHAPTKLECMKQVNAALGVSPVTELK
jgi:hypothetical protein